MSRHELPSPLIDFSRKTIVVVVLPRIVLHLHFKTFGLQCLISGEHSRGWDDIVFGPGEQNQWHLAMQLIQARKKLLVERSHCRTAGSERARKCKTQLDHIVCACGKTKDIHAPGINCMALLHICDYLLDVGWWIFLHGPAFDLG